MDENTKKKIILIKDLIKKQKIQQALDQAEVLYYKQPKLYQAHLMAGLCCEKLNKLKQAQRSYLQVLDLKPEEPNALKALCDLYVKMNNTQKSALYMEAMLKVLKTTDPLKYRQNLVKLVDIYQKNLQMQKISQVWAELLESQNQITQQFAKIAEVYFNTAVTNQCFYLDQFMPLGVRGQTFRALQPNAKQKLNRILVQIARYLYSVKIQYGMSNKDIATSIYQLKQCFPHASCFLMLFLFDEYIVSQAAYNSAVLQQIYLFLSAFYDKANNCYLNIETLQPEYCVVSAILSYQFLAFMKQFFILDECFNLYYQKLGSQLPQLESRKIREQYSQKISRFILKQCRTVNKISETQNIQNRLQSLKYRIIKLDGSYLEQVVAKMAMNCFVNYQKLSDMKNLLKTRINNLKQGQLQPHLYKYYYDYLIKIAKLYKSLDQQLSIYDVINYIKTHDQIDNKYLVQHSWIELGKNSKKSKQQFLQTVNESLKNIQDLLPKLTGSVKSQSIRKQTILQIILQEYNGVLDGFKLALGTDRSFQNLQSMGFYYFIQGDYERSLRFLKQAFVIKQDDYHLNRAIFVAMVKTNDQNQAYSFLQRIYQGFPNVYWVNFALAINYLNHKKIQLAYKHLTASLQAYAAGIGKAFKFSYEKTVQRNKYSLIYMIDQNDKHLFLDQIVIPEKTIYQIFPMASSIFFESQQELKQIRIETLLGQVLKILGRNKSSFNHLATAYTMLQALPQQARNKYPLQVISTKKQFATILFYVRAYKQAEQILKNTLKICQKYEQSTQIPKNLLTVYQSQIHSLIFEVSVMRLNQLMKFESYQAVEEYINKFSQDLKQMKGLLKKPSLNYYKAKYQFYILCYLHNKNLGVQQSIQTIKQYLQFFDLDARQIESDKFYNRLVELSTQQQIIVKECLQDYYVLLYLKQNSSISTQNQKITAENILPLIQLFPTSSVFYIVYGMAVKETKLKISAFLKCIQLDRQSPISVDLLASLFLKQKDYLTACKLFLKSLEIDLFNPKSYIGLCTCLYVLIGTSIKRGNPQDKPIIRKALSRINSYMDFLRISDPSQNYHLLKFLKTLISDEPIPLFDLKAGLQQSRKLTAHKYSQKLLFQLLQDTTQYLKQFNVWKKEGQQQILQLYLQKNQVQTKEDLYEIGNQILSKLQKQISQYRFNQIKSGQIRIKIKCKILNKVCILGNIFVKAKKLQNKQLDRFIKLCEILEQSEQIKDQQLSKLQKLAKEILINAVIKSSKQNKVQGAKVLSLIKQINLRKLFKKSPTFTHIRLFLDNFTRQQDLLPLKRYIFTSIHLFPCDEILRKVLLGWLLIVQKQNNKIPKKIKQSIDYRLQGMFQMNSDSQINNTARFHKKHAIMFNMQQPNAWIGFIASQWQAKKQAKWLQHLIKINKKYQDYQNKLTIDSKQKCNSLIIQMAAYKLKNKQDLNLQKIPEKLLSKVKILSKFFNMSNATNDHKQLLNALKNSPKNEQIWIMKYLGPYLVNRYEHSKQLQQLIEKCIEEAHAKEKGFYYLLNFVSLCSKPATNEDNLIDQLKKLLTIVDCCQSKDDVKVHINALSIMKCMVSLLSLNYEQLEQQLNIASGKRIQAYTDSIIINYFELMRIYREVEVNHQGENVYENFIYFVDCMIGLVKQPFMKGYFYALKAMAGTIFAQQSTQKLSKQLKMALLLSPQVGKSILMKK